MEIEMNPAMRKYAVYNRQACRSLQSDQVVFTCCLDSSLPVHVHPESK